MTYFPAPPSRFERFKEMLPDIVIGIVGSFFFVAFLASVCGLLVVVSAAMDKL